MVSTLTMCHHANGRQHCHDGISTIRHYHCHDINIIIIVASSRQHYHHDIFTVQPSCHHYYNDISTITIMSSLSSPFIMTAALSCHYYHHHNHHANTIIPLSPCRGGDSLCSASGIQHLVAIGTLVPCCIAIHVCTYSYAHMYTPTWVYLSQFTSWAKGVLLANRNRTSDRWMSKKAEAYNYTTVHRSTNWAIAR